MAHVEIEAKGVQVRIDLLFGMISGFTVERDGRSISMLHKAPWVGDGSAMPEDAAPHLGGLAGDFFCAPFGDASADGSGHGLIGMRERVEVWGGELTAGAAPGGGYRVKAQIPYCDAE